MPDLAISVAEPPVRRRVVVRGIVQGVGFRPFVWRLASELALAGWVRNDAQGVTIEVEGERSRIDRLVRRLTADSPARARVDSVVVEPCALAQAGQGFAILESGAGRAATAIGPDGAICAECLDDLFDPTGRRYRYAFTNCTHCGPRYTIARELPYDRATTSMAAFQQCPDCLAEYTSPADRRFHAEPNACPACGPRLSLHAASGAAERDADPISLDAIANTPRRDRRDQGAGRLPSRLRRAQCRSRRTAARTQGARRKAVRRDGERRERRRRFRADVIRGAGAPRIRRAPDRAAAQDVRRRRCARRRCAGARVARRDVALHADSLSAVPRSRRPAGRHRMDRRRHRPRAGHDEREPRRRAPRDAQRGGVRAALGHRRRVPAARPQHRHPLRRQRAARGRRGIGPAVPVRPPGAWIHAACDPAGQGGAVGRRAGGLFQEHGVRDARRRSVRFAARGRARQRADRERARRHRRAPGVDPRDRARGRRARPARRFLQHAPCGAARLALGRADVRRPAPPRAHRRGGRRASRDGSGARTRPRRRRPRHRRDRVGRRASPRRRRALPADRAHRAAAPAGRRSRGAGTVAHGGGGAASREARRRDRGALRRRARGGDGRDDAGTRLPVARDEQHGPLVRRGGGTARRAAPDGLRRPGGDAARGARRTPRNRRAGSRALCDRRRQRARPHGARAATRGRARRRIRRRAVSRDARRRAGRMGRTRGRYPRRHDRRVRRRMLSQRDPRARVARAARGARHHDARGPRGPAQRRRALARAGVGRDATGQPEAADHVPRDSRARRRDFPSPERRRSRWAACRSGYRSPSSTTWLPATT